MNVEAGIGALCFVLAFIANIAALAYGYGVLGNTVKNNKTDISEVRQDTIELFNRMRAIESLAVRLEDAAVRWEKIMSNGINAKIESIQDRLTRIEQHCMDKHGQRETDR